MLAALQFKGAVEIRRLCLRTGMTGLVIAFSSGLLHAQTPPPKLKVIASGADSNVIVQISSQSGFFYTVQRSADLANWFAITTLFATSGALTWTSSTAGAPKAGFFRAKANSPNRAVVTNYNGWTNAVVLDNGLVEAVIVPDAGR